jgi:hypothetical protein
MVPHLAPACLKASAVLRSGFSYLTFCTYEVLKNTYAVVAFLGEGPLSFGAADLSTGICLVSSFADFLTADLSASIQELVRVWLTFLRWCRLHFFNDFLDRFSLWRRGCRSILRLASSLVLLGSCLDDWCLLNESFLLRFFLGIFAWHVK